MGSAIMCEPLHVALLILLAMGGGGPPVEARVSRGAIAAPGQRTPPLEQPERMGLWIDAKQVERFAGKKRAAGLCMDIIIPSSLPIMPRALVHVIVSGLYMYIYRL